MPPKSAADWMPPITPQKARPIKTCSSCSCRGLEVACSGPVRHVSPIGKFSGASLASPHSPANAILTYVHGELILVSGEHEVWTA